MKFVSRIALAIAFATTFNGCGQAQDSQELGNIAYAQEDGLGEIDCGSPTTQSELTICATHEYSALDKEMSDLYFSLTKSQTLLAAQRAWLAYRDAQCKYEHHATPNGSMYGMETAMCMSELTKQRIETLRRAKDEQYEAGN